MTGLIVLSPHRDDAVFSLAIALSHWRNLPLEIGVFNFFTWSGYGPHAISMEAGQAADISGQRQREDHRAIAAIDRRIRVFSAGLIDAPLRLHREAGSVCDLNQVSIRECDVKVVSAILKKLSRVSAVIGPLGLGNHVDHLTVRTAAMNAIRPRALAFYEDLPYATWTAEQEILERVRQTENYIHAPLRAMTLKSGCNGRLKRRLAGLYKSQIRTGEAAAISGFASKYNGGERIWIPRHSSLWDKLVRAL